jgi:hypothetical protein
MTTNARKERRTYHGPRPRGSAYPSGPVEVAGAAKSGAKTVSRVRGDTSSRGTILLPLRVKPNGRWGYRFRALRSR